MHTLIILNKLLVFIEYSVADLLVHINTNNTVLLACFIKTSLAV